MVKGICLDRKTVTAMLDLHDREWKEFRICDIFIIKAGKRLTKSDMTSGNKPFIGATDNNNGITEFVSNTNVSEDCNVLGVNYNGSVVENFYHPYTCIFSDDVKRFQTKQVQGNKYIYLFMKTVILAISLMRNECRSNLCCSPLMNPAILIMPLWNSTSRNVSSKLYKIILIILATIYKSGGYNTP